MSQLRQALETNLERALERYFSASALFEAIRYAILPTGKLLRPLLSATVARDLGWAGDISWSVALEFLHVASLIHDDLPALDNDDIRRGRPALHRKFGEACAILSADALTAAAFDCVLATDRAGPERVKILAGAFVRLCNGQQLDLQGNGVDKREVARLKTGALFGATLEMAYITANTTAPDRAQFRLAGESLGVAFQEIDDLYDSNSTVVEESINLPSVVQARKNFESLSGIGQESAAIAARCLDIRLNRKFGG